MRLALAACLLLALLAGPVQIATAQQAIDKSAEMQAGRLKLMEKLKVQGVFQKVEMPGTLPQLYVAPRFYTIDFDLKQKFVSVVYAYYFDGKSIADTVRIIDSKNGKEIGSYSIQTGLKLD